MTQLHESMFPHILKGLQAGFLKAIEKARQTNTSLVVWQNGKMVEITPDEAQMFAQQGKKAEI